MKVQSVNEVIFLSGLLLVQGSNVLRSPDAVNVCNCFWGEQWPDDWLSTWIMEKYLVLYLFLFQILSWAAD